MTLNGIGSSLISFTALDRLALQAGVNVGIAVSLIVGRVAILKGRPLFHRTAMVTAFALSTIFLGLYLSASLQGGSLGFQGTGVIRTVYRGILASQTILAVGVVPLGLVTFSLALRGNFDRHKKWARWTWPLWLYVSITGVVIYLFLAHGQP